MMNLRITTHRAVWTTASLFLFSFLAVPVEAGDLKFGGSAVSIIAAEPAERKGLIINEVMASNGGELLDAEGDSRDWIELYNDSAEAVNLKGYEISDDDADWTFGDVTVGAGEYLVVFASDKRRKDSDEQHTNFEICDKGETLTLKDGTETEVDKVYTGEMPRGYSRGWVNGEFVLIKKPSPGAANAEAESSVTVAINEVMGESDAEIAGVKSEVEGWVELYNYGSEPVDLTGYNFIYDGDKWEFPTATIKPQEFLLVLASGEDADGDHDGNEDEGEDEGEDEDGDDDADEDEGKDEDGDEDADDDKTGASTGGSSQVLVVDLVADIELDNDMSILKLADSSGGIVDSMVIGKMPDNVSRGRQEDGTGKVFFFSEATPKAANDKEPLCDRLAQRDYAKL